MRGCSLWEIVAAIVGERGPIFRRALESHDCWKSPSLCARIVTHSTALDGACSMKERATPPVDTKKIRFVANQPWLKRDSASRPGPIIKTLPDWYTRADWFVPDPVTGKPAESLDGGGKMPTWKACPAVLDVMGTGYTYKTPCDIEFAEDAAGNIQGRVLDVISKLSARP